MKKLVMIITLLILGTAGFAQGIEFRNANFEDIIKIAKNENKAIFIDVHTSWCGPCKALSTDIFPQKVVGDIFNKNFICFKADAEKSEDGREIAKKYNVTAYPTLLFVNSDGELVYRFLGYRDAKGIQKEAEKAMIAYEMFPTIKSLEKEYWKGTRSKEFLNEYFLAMDKSGLDCGKVLVDYFKLLSDSEIIDIANVKRIEKITFFDKQLTNRIIDIAVKESQEHTLDKKNEAALNRAIGKFMSECLSASTKKDTADEFEEILELKKKFFTIPTNKNSITAASLGGGNIYVPSELLSLDFYSSKNMKDKFVNVYDNYINILKKEYDESKESRELLAKNIEEKIEAAIKNGDQKELKPLKSLISMMNLFSGMDSYYISANMANNVEKYIKMYTGEKNSDFYIKIESTYLFLNEYYPSCKNAIFIANKLKDISKPQGAIAVLKLALDKGTQAIEVKEEQIKQCRDLLDQLSKG